MRTFVLAGILSFFVGGCSDSQLRQPYQLDGLRILAVVADQPEVSDSSATVTLTPVVSDVNGAGRVLTVKAYGCASPNLGGGALPTCTGASDRVTLVDTTYDPQAVTAGDFLRSSDYTGTLNTFTATIPSGFLSGQSILTQTNGRDYLIELKITGGGKTVSSIKRIKVSGRTSPNTNPVFDTIDLDGEPLLDGAEYPGAGMVEVTATEDSSENYSILATSGEIITLQEQLTVQILTTRGEFERSYAASGGEVRFTPLNSSTPATFVLILTDGRGGSAVEFRRF